MKSLGKLIKVTVSVVVGVSLFVVSNLSFNIFAALSDQDIFGQTTRASTLTLQTPSCGLPYLDEFNNNVLNLTKWDKQGDVTVDGGKLILSGDATARAEVQSKCQFRYAILQATIESPDWVTHTEHTDSSFGFELWRGDNEQCHYGVIFISDGHLGLLRPEPDINNECSVDPEHQEYPKIPNWNQIRASNRITLTLTWSQTSVTLDVTDGSHSGVVSYTGLALPTVPLEIRLNTDFCETYYIDYVRVYSIENGSLLNGDFVSQSIQGEQFWSHYRRSGVRGQVNEASCNFLPIIIK